MAKLNTKIVMLKGEQGKDGTTIKSVEKTASSGLTDTYTITLTDGSTSTFNVTNGKDGELTNLDDTLSTTSTNPIQNKAVANAINALNTSVNSLSKLPAYYGQIIPEKNIIHPDGTNYAVLGSSNKEFEEGLYLITYDVFLLSASEAGYKCSVELQAETKASLGLRTWAHNLIAPMFGDLAFGINVSYTDFIELVAPSKVLIVANNLGECDVRLGNEYGDGTAIMALKLR